MKKKTLYAITTEDLINVAEDMNIPFSEKNLPYLEDKIGDFMADKWRDAIEYALAELKNKKL